MKSRDKTIPRNYDRAAAPELPAVTAAPFMAAMTGRAGSARLQITTGTGQNCTEKNKIERDTKRGAQTGRPTFYTFPLSGKTTSIFRA